MLLTSDMADSFGDWLELGHIQRALIASLPELSESISHDAHRPLLRIRRPGGEALIIARAADDANGRWIVGFPAHPAPVLRDADSLEEVISIVLSALGRPDTDKARNTADAGE